ncbi:MAG: phosphotransferase [Pseudomonadota bacterium]
MNASTAVQAGTDHDARLMRLSLWLGALDSLQLNVSTLRPASSDASFRRYFRVEDAGGATYVVMDAPPGLEDCAPYIKVARLLAAQGVRVPKIFAGDERLGALVLSDLGSHTYTQAFTQGVSQPQFRAMWQAAISEILLMQGTPTQDLPAYERADLRKELNIFIDWYWQHHLGAGEVSSTCLEALDRIAQQVARQERCFVHRDLHSPNLICSAGSPVPGNVDFQDAVDGPYTYDLVSLATDARWTWSVPQQEEAIAYFWGHPARRVRWDRGFSEFRRDCDWTSAQRNLRIAGVLCRLAYRDGKPAYLAHLDRVLDYCRQAVVRLPELAPLAQLLGGLA